MWLNITCQLWDSTERSIKQWESNTLIVDVHLCKQLQKTISTILPIQPQTNTPVKQKTRNDQVCAINNITNRHKTMYMYVTVCAYIFVSSRWHKCRATLIFNKTVIFLLIISTVNKYAYHAVMKNEELMFNISNSEDHMTNFVSS